MNFSLKKSVIGLGAGLFIAAQATAMPLVTTFDWSLTAAWTEWNPVGVPGEDSPAGQGVLESGLVTGLGPLEDQNGYSHLEWGRDIGNGKSSLTIENPVLDSTAGDPQLVLVEQPSGIWTASVDGTLFTHDNNDIRSPASWLTSLVLSEVFRVAPAGVPLASVTPVAPAFDVAFQESVNHPDIGDCPDYQVSGTGCDDIFLILNPGGLSFSFNIPGDDIYTYFVNVTNDNLFPVDPLICNEVSEVPVDACNGLVTEEDVANQFQFFINITARDTTVSEPSILALMGLGLLGFGIRRRRQSK